MRKFRFDFDRTYHDPNADPDHMCYEFTLEGSDELFDTVGDLSEEPHWLKFVGSMESYYGVHDWDSGGDVIVGYHSYEITEGNEKVVVDHWRNYLTKLGFTCGPIVINEG